MSEYWKSTPKYWCKHCSAYVKDTPFERKQHENTGKHQGNLKRFLRGIQNDHERGEREKEKVKAEIARLNKVTGGSQGTTADTSLPSLPSAKSSIARTSTSAPLSATEQKKQWAQLAEMGIQVPENFRAEMAMPGSWQQTSDYSAKGTDKEEALSIGVRKRKFDDQEEVEAIQTLERRGWGSTTKRYPGQEQDDLDTLIQQPLLRRNYSLEEDSKILPSNTRADDTKLSTSLNTEPASTAEVPSSSIKEDHVDLEGSNGKLAIKTEASDEKAQVLTADVVVKTESPVLFKKRKPRVR